MSCIAVFTRQLGEHHLCMAFLRFLSQMFPWDQLLHLCTPHHTKFPSTFLEFFPHMWVSQTPMCQLHGICLFHTNPEIDREWNFVFLWCSVAVDVCTCRPGSGGGTAKAVWRWSLVCCTSLNVQEVVKLLRFYLSATYVIPRRVLIVLASEWQICAVLNVCW